MSAATIPPPVRATLDDLMRYDGKAELIGGRVVPAMMIGIRHSRVASRIFVSLLKHEETTKSGYAFDDNLAYGVPELSSGRESFSPDCSFFIGQLSLKDPSYVKGPPTFAVEVRSPEESGPAAERTMAAKRDDYFEAGTKAVWDVDPKTEIVTLHVPGQMPIVFRKGDTAHAEPALSGWTMKVDDIFG